MTSINKVIFVLAAFGSLYTASGQMGTGGLDFISNLTLGNLIDAPQASGANVTGDVTLTVMSLLKETGYSAKANDANVQEIVNMLMNGTVPKDADLMRMGIISPPASPQSTPPPYIIAGNPVGLDPSLNFPAFNMPSGSQTGSQAGAPAGAFLLSPPMSVASGTGNGGMNPFGSNSGTPVLAGNPLVIDVPATTSKPLLGDPFSMNSVAASMVPSPGLGLSDLNALGPKPFSSAGPIGGLGTPGSPTDLLGNVGFGGAGMGSIPQPQPMQTGILDTVNQRNRQRSAMNNPMMMMMMMNPELMEGMMAENPMMAYYMMQQFNRPRPRPRPRPRVPTLPSYQMDMGGLSGIGGPTDLGAGGLASLQLPGSSATGAGAGGMMDLMNSMGTGAAGSVVPPAIVPMGIPAGPTLDATGLSAGLSQGSLTGMAGGPSPGLTDMTSMLNMVNTGVGPSMAPATDPLLGMAG